MLVAWIKLTGPASPAAGVRQPGARHEVARRGLKRKRRGRWCGPAVSAPSSRSDYWTAFIMSKIGRYIAMTMPPTITPRITIIAGSIRLRSALTATSTSSS
jgi:hypothetical protein